ncbi:MAG: hypothetical protein HZA25_00980 [Candidatus Niyogibacteria bacterium]|nr:hypothetical protein [Candidatus Niyogibacteria bacterium]
MSALLHYKYFAVFLLAFFEGPMVAMAVGVMVAFGQLVLLPAYIALLFGDFIPDLGLYFVGRFAHSFNFLERFDTTRSLSKSSLAKLDALWHGHTGKVMAIGKLAYGLSSPILASAGLVRLPFWKYMRVAIPITLVQYAFFLGVGYYFAGSYQALHKYFKFAEITLAAAVAAFLFFVVRKLAANYVKQNILNGDNMRK